MITRIHRPKLNAVFAAAILIASVAFQPASRAGGKDNKNDDGDEHEILSFSAV